MNLVQKIEEWLKEEVVETEGSENSEYLDDLVVEGRHECAESLLAQIKKWKKELGIEVAYQRSSQDG